MKLTCQSCWAQVEIQAWMITHICKYCNTISIIEKNVLTNTWEKSIIIPFPSIFEIWKYIYLVNDNYSNDKIREKNVTYLDEKQFYESKSKDYLLKIYIYWQIRYLSDWWFWDDYFVRVIENKFEMDYQKEYVLSENQWLISLNILNKTYTNVSLEIFNSWVWSNWNNYFIQEKWEYKIEWFAWSFPFIVKKSDISKYIVLLKDKKQTQLKCISNNIIQLTSI